jgi:uridine monophosphate synthetase
MNIINNNTHQHATIPIDHHKEQLILKLHDIGAIMFGTFTLKSGIVSPIYIDLRKIISAPALFHTIEEQLWHKIQHCSFDLLCGVPTAAIPLATSIAFKRHQPMIMVRPSIKNHGTKQAIEGIYTTNNTVLIVEDLVTSGHSIFETITILKENNLNVKDVLVILNREGGGTEKLAQQGYQLHALCTLSEVINVLERTSNITRNEAANARYFVENPKPCCS